MTKVYIVDDKAQQPWNKWLTLQHLFPIHKIDFLQNRGNPVTEARLAQFVEKIEEIVREINSVRDDILSYVRALPTEQHPDESQDADLSEPTTLIESEYDLHISINCGRSCPFCADDAYI